MTPALLTTFFPLVVAISTWYRGKHSEQATRFSTLALIFACCAVSAHVFVTRNGVEANPLLAITHMVCFILTLYFSARIVRLAGFRWYDVIVLLYAFSTVAFSL